MTQEYESGLAALAGYKEQPKPTKHALTITLPMGRIGVSRRKTEK